MQDKRKLKRRAMLYNLEIHEAETGEPAGWLVDINAEGIKISSERTYSKNQRIELVIHTPEEILGRTEIPFAARVRWCMPDANKQFIATGLQLEKIATEDYETLIGFMAKYAMIT